MKTLITLICLGAVAAASQPVVAQPSAPDDELKKICQTLLCRQPAPIRLRLAGGEKFEMTPSFPTPIVAGEIVTVYPGETIHIEARVERDRLVDLKAVETARHLDRTLTFRLEQDARIGDGTNMVLKVESPFPGVLKFRLGMMLPTGDDLLKTSACPVRGGTGSFEHWPEPIFQIVATDFRFVASDSPAANTCE